VHLLLVNVNELNQYVQNLTTFLGFYILQRHCSVTTNYIVGLRVNIQKPWASVGRTDAIHLPFFVMRLALNLL
jgi:hypothetical protein